MKRRQLTIGGSENPGLLFCIVRDKGNHGIETVDLWRGIHSLGGAGRREVRELHNWLGDVLAEWDEQEK
jgi:hypothetical protein